MLVYGKYEYFVMQMYVCVCMTYSLLILVDYARGDHMKESYSRAGLMTSLFIGSHACLLLFDLGMS